MRYLIFAAVLLIGGCAGNVPQLEYREYLAEPYALIETVYFPFGVGELPKEERAKLRKYRLRRGEYQIVGYACTFGTDSYNKTLAEDRAAEVRGYVWKGAVVTVGAEVCESECRTSDSPECQDYRKVEVRVKR